MKGRWPNAIATSANASHCKRREGEMWRGREPVERNVDGRMDEQMDGCERKRGGKTKIKQCERSCHPYRTTFLNLSVSQKTQSCSSTAHQPESPQDTPRPPESIISQGTDRHSRGTSPQRPQPRQSLTYHVVRQEWRARGPVLTQSSPLRGS